VSDTPLALIGAVHPDPSSHFHVFEILSGICMDFDPWFQDSVSQAVVIIDVTKGHEQTQCSGKGTPSRDSDPGRGKWGAALHARLHRCIRGTGFRNDAGHSFSF